MIIPTVFDIAQVDQLCNFEHIQISIYEFPDDIKIVIEHGEECTMWCFMNSFRRKIPDLGKMLPLWS